MKGKGCTISNQHPDTTVGDSLSEILDPSTFECELFIFPLSENHEYKIVCDEFPVEGIPSSSEFEDLHVLHTNLFDNDHPHEKPSIYHAIHSLHYSFSNETLNDIPYHKECPTLIDQTPILNDTSSVMYQFENPSQFQFLEHVDSQSNHYDHIFDDYFSVLELSVGTNLSFVDPLQSEISNLDAHMIITGNIKYAEHHDSVHPHEEITSNEQPITM